MRFELILTVTVVNFGFKCVKSYHQMEHEVITTNVNYDKGRMRENYQNLFNSVAKNDRRTMELFREALHVEASKGQQVYDAMKNEIHSARIKNSHKKMDLYQKNEISKRVAREMRPGARGCEVKDGTILPPGRLIMNPSKCMVLFCSSKMELEDYGCDEVKNQQNRYPMFWSECNAADCFRRG